MKKERQEETPSNLPPLSPHESSSGAMPRAETLAMFELLVNLRRPVEVPAILFPSVQAEQFSKVYRKNLSNLSLFINKGRHV